MISFQKVRIVFILYILCLPVVSATPNTIYANVGLSLTTFDFSEYSDSDEQLLTEENRFLPGISAEIHAVKGDYSGIIGIKYSSGKADYRGRTNTGVPHQTTTDEQLLRVTFKAGRSFEDFIHTPISVFLGVDRFLWRRSIHNYGQVSGLDETYSSSDAFAEIQWIHNWVSDLSIGLVLRGIKSVNPKVEVAIP